MGDTQVMYLRLFFFFNQLPLWLLHYNLFLKKHHSFLGAIIKSKINVFAQISTIKRKGYWIHLNIFAKDWFSQGSEHILFFLIILEVLPINWQFPTERKQNSLAFLTAKSYNNTRTKTDLSLTLSVLMSELLEVRNEITPTLANTVAKNILSWKLNSKSTFSSFWRLIYAVLTLSNR